MKKNLLKSVLLTASMIFLFTGCTKDDDFNLQPLKSMLFSEDFSYYADGTHPLEDRGWTRFTETGTVGWGEGEYSHDAYGVFDTYQSPDAVNIGWMISPAINLDGHTNEKLLFQAAQAYVSDAANSLEVLISTDFDGTQGGVLTANWTSISFNQPVMDYDHNFVYANSEIDLSSYTGNIYVAFKVKGSGTNTALDGTYQIDNIRVIY